MKIFDIININTVNIIYLLSIFYKNIKIIKPHTSRPNNTERYVICSNFIGIEEDKYDTIKNKLFSILDKIKPLSDGTWPKFSKDPLPYFNIFDSFNYEQDVNQQFIDFNNSIIIKTQYFYQQSVLDILNTNKHYAYQLINQYFSKKSNNNLLSLLQDNSFDIGYFINKIYASIKLCNYIKIPIKNNYIYLIDSIKKQKKCILDDNCNLYPPHFKEKYDIDNDPDQNTITYKINQFVNKYCISFDINNIIPSLHYKIIKLTENFINNQYIKNINHIIISKIKQNKDDIKTLHNILVNHSLNFRYSQTISSLFRQNHQYYY